MTRDQFLPTEVSSLSRWWCGCCLPSPGSTPPAPNHMAEGPHALRFQACGIQQVRPRHGTAVGSAGPPKRGSHTRSSHPPQWTINPNSPRHSPRRCTDSTCRCPAYATRVAAISQARQVLQGEPPRVPRGKTRNDLQRPSASRPPVPAAGETSSPTTGAQTGVTP